MYQFGVSYQFWCCCGLLCCLQGIENRETLKTYFFQFGGGDFKGFKLERSALRMVGDESQSVDFSIASVVADVALQ